MFDKLFETEINKTLPKNMEEVILELKNTSNKSDCHGHY